MNLLFPTWFLLGGLSACAGPVEPLSGVLPTDWASDLADDAGPGAAADPAECAPVEPISCGDYVWGDTSDPNSGATTVIDGYPVATGNFSGAEIAWEFVAPHSGEVTWRLEDPTPTEMDHDVFVLAGDGSCRSDRALQRGHNAVTFDAVAGERYYLLLDGFDGDSGLFDAHLDCGDPAENPNPLPPGEPPATCDGVRGLWDSDALQVVAQCDSLLDGAASGSPSHPVDDAGICLARGVFGLNGAEYYVLSGTVLSESLGYEVQVYGVAFLDGGDGSYVIEGADGVTLHSASLGHADVDDGDYVTEARWSVDSDTLHVRRYVDGWGGSEDVIYSALLRCSGGTP